MWLSTQFIHSFIQKIYIAPPPAACRAKACSSLVTTESARAVNSRQKEQQLRMHDAAQSRCLHGELRVCHQKRNEALDAQPGSTQGSIWSNQLVIKETHFILYPAIHHHPDPDMHALQIIHQLKKIYLFRLFLQHLFKSTTTQRCSQHSTDTVSVFHAEAPQATASEGLAQGPYVAARVGFEPTALRTKGVESTNEPPHPTS